MIPNLAHVVRRFEQPVQLKVYAQNIIDFEPVETYVTSEITATVQTADKEKLQVDNVDWSKEYKMVHTTASLQINDVIVYKSRDYRIIDVNDSDDYGFHECVAEEVK